MRPSLYGWAMMAAIGAGLLVWRRAFKKDERLFPIFLGGLVGAMAGAKLVYLLSEAWFDYGRPGFWMRAAVGRSIVGGLLGGYGAVELVKRWVGYSQPTGDQFAAVLPLSVAIGRVGCLNYGCCLGARCEPAWYTVADRQGTPRWPSVQLEMLFNLAAFAAFYSLRRRGLARGAHFFIYLTAYGLFRAAHEFLRDTPRLVGPFSGYFFASALMVVLGARGWRARVRGNTGAREAVPRPSPGESAAA